MESQSQAGAIDPEGNRFGSLPNNYEAMSKRRNMKFFDSAEWAMTQETTERSLSLRGKVISDPLPKPTTDEISKYIRETFSESSPLEI